MSFGRLITAMVTPFNEKLEIDWEVTGRLIDYLIEEQRSESLVVSGTTKAATDAKASRAAKTRRPPKRSVGIPIGRPASEPSREAGSFPPRASTAASISAAPAKHLLRGPMQRCRTDFVCALHVRYLTTSAVILRAPDPDSSSA